MMTFNMVAECFAFLLSVLILFLMIYTKPRRTPIYIIDFLGVILSLVSIVLHIYLLNYTYHPQNFKVSCFNLLSLLYFAICSVIIVLIFTYIAMLSSKRSFIIKKVLCINVVLFAVCLATNVAFLLTGKMYILTDNSIILTPYFYTNIIFGVIDAALCLAISIINRYTIAKKIFLYIVIFISVDFILLVFQFLNPQIQYVGITYILPFTVFYCLFHSNPYDEISGCQNKYSFETRIMDNNLFKRKYLIVNVIFPKIRQLDYDYVREHIRYLTAERCRQIERINNHMHVFSLNVYNYAVITSISNDSQVQSIVEQIIRIIEAPITQNINATPIHYKLIAFKNHSYINNLQKLYSMQKYLFSKLGQNMKNESYIASEKDYEDFITRYQVELLLNDIKTKLDLNDERVLCYAQPIYSVADQSFRTAEALMRLELDGQTIYPDKFIPIAEQNGCIHALTCIILNKVCAKIHELEQSYDFDAITVNCSTMELSDTNLYRELLDIIHKNDIPCSKIRLELTESAMADNFDVVVNNIEQLRSAGVQFYLDDFGTGYSNLERIISCPFKTIKFDKSLLYKSMDDQGMDNLVVSMVDVFKKQGFILLVEGVEDDAQSRYSIDRGFNYIQGYKYARPVPIAELSNYFSPF